MQIIYFGNMGTKLMGTKVRGDKSSWGQKNWDSSSGTKIPDDKMSSCNPSIGLKLQFLICSSEPKMKYYFFTIFSQNLFPGVLRSP